MKTAANVAADTGLPASTVAKWLEGVATPNLFYGFKLADAYGADFIAATWPRQMGFLAESARDAERRRLDAEIAAIEARRAKL